MTRQLSLFDDQNQSSHQCHFCQDIGRLGDYAFCWCDIGREVAKAQRRASVLADARALSSGTLASLTGITNYTDLEAIQARFIDFVGARIDRFDTWQEAWEAFAAK